ncbi:MAG: phosphoribosylamine--glycine ligase [Candidatus Aminicenantales bacterium]
MKVLVIGSGGREHALAWKIAQSPLVEKIFCAPGNAGTGSIAENVAISDSDVQGLVDFAAEKEIGLTVVGPELPLTLGIVDEFEKKGLKIFGPNKKAAELEGSKIFAKQFMERHRIPTARFKLAETPDKARTILNSGEFKFPLVIKADGLAAGKGVIICPEMKRAEEAVQSIMVDKHFGEAGSRILIEECLEGREVSFIVISDGTKVLPLVTTMDHKAVLDGDRGPNTGGMGAISPSPYLDRRLFQEIVNTIVFPTIIRMKEEGRSYQGALYVGLMLTDDGPKVLEYNCRFGDPETQPQVLRMESDLVEILLSALENKLLDKDVRWSKKASGCVILASGGYPGTHEKGKVIKGLEEVSQTPGITIFHAGTRLEEGKYVTSGGRVLGIGAAEKTLAETMKKIYNAILGLYFEGMHFRRDIGAAKEED